jgi:hypothetical protein
MNAPGAREFVDEWAWVWVKRMARAEWVCESGVGTGRRWAFAAAVGENQALIAQRGIEAVQCSGRTQ